jgi:hypothetical protein
LGKTQEQKAAEREEQKQDYERRLAAREARSLQWTVAAQARKDGVPVPASPQATAHPSPGPISQATTAKEQGQGFSEIQLEVGSSQREVAMFGFKYNVVGRTTYLNSVKGESKTQTHAGESRSKAFFRKRKSRYAS